MSSDEDDFMYCFSKSAQKRCNHSLEVVEIKTPLEREQTLQVKDVGDRPC
jgi:hypothetical protein